MEGKREEEKKANTITDFDLVSQENCERKKDTNVSKHERKKRKRGIGAISFMKGENGREIKNTPAEGNRRRETIGKTKQKIANRPH